MKDKFITLLQTIINKIRGLQMTAPIPQEKFADYLEDVIGVVNDADLDVPNELPAVGTNDKNKFLHTNESTGALEWAEGGSGGGVLVVTDTDGTLDKTWAEIDAADCVVIRYNDGSRDWRLTEVATGEGKGGVAVSAYMGGAIVKWESETESGYPARP